MLSRSCYFHFFQASCWFECGYRFRLSPRKTKKLNVDTDRPALELFVQKERSLCVELQILCPKPHLEYGWFNNWLLVIRITNTFTIEKFLKACFTCAHLLFYFIEQRSLDLLVINHTCHILVYRHFLHIIVHISQYDITKHKHKSSSWMV